MMSHPCVNQLQNVLFAQVWQLLTVFSCIYLVSFFFFSIIWYIIWK